MIEIILYMDKTSKLGQDLIKKVAEADIEVQIRDANLERIHFLSAVPSLLILCDGKEWRRFEQRDEPLDLSKIKTVLETNKSIIKKEIEIREKVEADRKKAEEKAKQIRDTRITELVAKAETMSREELIELLKLKGVI